MATDSLYYVLPSDMVEQLNLDSIQENSYAEIRRSVDGTMAICEYKGAVQVRGGSYLTHLEAVSLMQTEDWFMPDVNDQVPL